MAHGGARNRSGPSPDPDSLASARRGLTFDVLNRDGYSDPAPEFPLPRMVIRRWEFEDKRRWQVLDVDATEAFAEREAELWEWAWRTPQATAWAVEPWRLHSVAMWVRTAGVCESSEATAADKNSLHRFADQIGLSPAGLKENGWTIGEVHAADDETGETAETAEDVRGRLSVVTGGAA